jgi:hypothetical protein
MEKIDRIIDRFGATLATVCLFHCLLLPILLATLPFIAFLGFMKHPLTETLMIIFAIGNAILAIRSCRKKHNSFMILAIFISGIFLLTLNFIAHKLVESNEYIITLGAFTIGVGHILNQKLNKSCPNCHEH